MIDKITVTLGESGFWVINIGDAIVGQIQDRRELIALINDNLNKLAYFPASVHAMCANPIPYEEFKNNQPKKRKR